MDKKTLHFWEMDTEVLYAKLWPENQNTICNLTACGRNFQWDFTVATLYTTLQKKKKNLRWKNMINNIN